jgi:hypothetical protein
MCVSTKKTTTPKPDEIHEIIKGGHAQPSVTLETIEKEIEEHRDEEFKPIRYGKLYCFDMKFVGLPHRLFISSLPKDKAFLPKEREVTAKGWFARAKTTRAVAKLIGVCEHKSSERRVGVYLLIMSDGMIAAGVSPKDLADSITEQNLIKTVEEYQPYTTLRVKLKLDDVRRSLLKFDDERYKDEEDYHSVGERYFNEGASEVTKAIQASFAIYKSIKRGKLGWLPSWASIKKALPWILLAVIIIAVGLYVIISLSPARTRLIMGMVRAFAWMRGWRI